MISDRNDFKKYILTALGQPVIRVNITDEQLDDRIDEAVDMWQQYHTDGSIRTVVKQRITASELYIQEIIEGDLDVSTEIKGEKSGATASVVDYSNGAKSNNHTIFCQDVKGRFLDGETITNGDHKFTLAKTHCFKIGIIDDRRIKMPPWILGVTKIIPVNQAQSSQNLFDVQYQMRLSDLYDITSTNLIYYEQAMEHLQLLNFELSANPWFEFNRHDGYVYPIMRWKYDASVGDYLLFEVYRACNPAETPQIWNDRWLKRYAIALAKRQWGVNLKKYGGIQLVGGVTLNGQDMYSEATQEIQQLEEELYRDIAPSAFFLG